MLGAVVVRRFLQGRHRFMAGTGPRRSVTFIRHVALACALPLSALAPLLLLSGARMKVFIGCASRHVKNSVLLSLRRTRQAPALLGVFSSIRASTFIVWEDERRQELRMLLRGSSW